MFCVAMLIIVIDPAPSIGLVNDASPKSLVSDHDTKMCFGETVRENFHLNIGCYRGGFDFDDKTLV